MSTPRPNSGHGTNRSQQEGVPPGQSSQLSPSHRSRGLRYTLSAGVAALLVFAMLFTLVGGTRRITDAAQQLNLVNEILRPATVVRAQLALGVNMAAQDREFGTNSSEGLGVSISETEAGLHQMADALVEFTNLGGSSEVIEPVNVFMSSSYDVLDALRAGDSSEAQRIAQSKTDSDFKELLAALVAERDELGEVVAEADTWLGRVGTWTRFAVAFLVPALVIFIYSEMARRRHRQAELEVSLSAERALAESRDEFIANASHELRTPLTSIYGLAHLLEEDGVRDDPDTARELVNMIIAESNDLGRIVEDLLTSARLDAGELSFLLDDMPICKLVDEVVGPMQRSGSAIAVDCADELVRVDGGRFRQLLRNLLSNARKYGGDEIRVVGRANGEMYTCTVEDNGSGVDANVEQRLFERFTRQETVATTAGSVGLGLSIAKALAEGHGGSITYERSDGWTRFLVEIPLTVPKHTDDRSLQAAM